MRNESVMPSNHLILCHPLFLLPSIFPNIRVFSNVSVLRLRWPNYWSFNISPSNEYSGLISFRIDWLDLLAVQGTLKNLLQHHSSKATILQHSAFFIVQLSHPYMTTGKTIALSRLDLCWQSTRFQKRRHNTWEKWKFHLWSVLQFLAYFSMPTSSVRVTAVKIILIKHPYKNQAFHGELCVQTWLIQNLVLFSFSSSPSPSSVFFATALQVAKNCCFSAHCRGITGRRNVLCQQIN